MNEQKVKVFIDSEWLLAKHEQEIREQIAKEIEALHLGASCLTHELAFNDAVQHAAAIARGNR